MKTLKPFLAGIALLMLLLIPQTSYSQEKIQPQTKDELEVELRTCMAATAVWKMSDKFALDAGYTMLTSDNLSRIYRNQLSIGVSYYPWKPLKLSVGYAYMAQYSKTGSLRPKHRAYFIAEGTLRTDNWKFSIYEKFQFTHSAYDVDPNQKPKNSLDLKSRAKAAYTSLKSIEPYGLIEFWNCFNAASYSADYDAQTHLYSNTQFLGYNDAYLTRFRAGVGLKWSIDKHNSLDFSFLLDYCRHKDIEYNHIFDELAVYRWDNKLAPNLSLGYVFAF